MSKHARALMAAALVLALMMGLVMPASAGLSVLSVDGANCIPGDENGEPTKPFCTIQAAVDAAYASAVIVIADGTYNENVLIDKELTLRSVNGAASTIIAGQTPGGTTAGAIRVAPGVYGVTIGNMDQGFTIQGAAPGAGIYLGSGIANLVVHYNTIMAAPGYNALLAEGGQLSAAIEHNTFLGSGASQLVYVNGQASVGNPSTSFHFRDNTFAGSATGPALATEATDSDITGNVFTTNTGYALLELWGTDSTVLSNTFEANLAAGAKQIVDGTASYEISTILGGNSFDRAVLADGGHDIWASIQDAVNAANSGGTVTVAAGTYNEDVVVGKSLALAGAQVGMHALDANRAAAAKESHLIGSVKVVAPATNVAIDGFEITATGAAPMAGVAVRTEVGNVDFVNNIVNAVAATGGYSYSGFVDMDGLSEAVVMNNKFQGEYDAARGPNVLRLGVSGAGPINVLGNTMISTGGGGGIGVMASNSSAVINVLNNTISNTGDGLWTYGSQFSQLNLTGNLIVNCQKAGVNVASGVSGAVVAKFNTITGNATGVANVAGNPVVDARNNWWGDASGPYHLTLNADGLSNPVTDLVDFEPWSGVFIEEVAAGVLGPEQYIGIPDRIEATYTGSTGSANVLVAIYEANPGADPDGMFSAGSEVSPNEYYDVQVLGAPADATLVVSFYTTEDQKALYWYDGGMWKQVRNNDGTVPAWDDTLPGYTVTFGPASTPRLDQLTGTPFGTGPEAAAAPIAADTDSIVVGDKVTINIWAGATDLYAAEFQVSWLMSEWSGTADDITLGGFLSPDFVTRKTVTDDGTTATATIAFGQQIPVHSTGVAGVGVLASIELTAQSVGDLNVNLSNVVFSDSDGLSIPVNVTSPVTVTVSEAGSVGGYVQLQGRTDHAGATAVVTPGEFPAATTASDGSFGIAGLRPYSYQYEVRASMPGYLTTVAVGVRVNAGGNTDLGLIKLLGGDATHDQLINIQDLAFMGQRFNLDPSLWQVGANDLVPSDGWADINGDGTINILDLALGGVNFGKAAPQNWPGFSAN